MHKFDDRFARQNRFELPPEFPLASPYSCIVHHLSGLNICAPAQTFCSKAEGWLTRQGLHPYRLFYFHYARRIDSLVLAHMLNSLVRVSRRELKMNFDNYLIKKGLKINQFLLDLPLYILPLDSNHKGRR